MLCFLGLNLYAQEPKNKDKDKEKYKREFCGKNDGWYGNRYVYSNDLREKTVSAASGISVASDNGRITVKGADRRDVLVRACVKVRGANEAEANSLAQKVTIATSPTIRAENTPENNWSVSYEIHVPRTTNLNLTTRNGRITISAVNGQIRFESGNGRITLSDVAGDVKGKTSNGRVTVRLSGATWQGSGLDVRTGNGRVSLYMPASYAANVEAGTGNGRFSSDFEALSIKDGKKRRYGRNKVSASINGGGAPLRLATGNGRVSIRSN